ncbi:DUF1361 domain-containing protein [Aquimarina muelleri]|uniref:DUF1361 domain-containing protein n=1 Tax=Aquimarina muelleri TaxID=279356 RepID=UPI00041D7B3A|nr:DUF1361 domain-containing protein [Aquimarina muelleri]MCX2764421.1 DUF1361 domain-containing protein [Aquimarina muelleri]
MNTILQNQLPFIKTFVVTVLFSFTLLLIRVIKTDSTFYLFLVWNLFLACIPYAITLILCSQKTNSFIFWIGFACWLVFLPNSPYILTDLQHIKLSTLESVWFDVLLILSFAINGLVAGFASLSIIQTSLQKKFSNKIANFIVYFILLLCGFGIYLGRVLRWNSWDILQDPTGLLLDIAKRILFPYQHINTWFFTITFGVFLIIIYRMMNHYEIRKIK